MSDLSVTAASVVTSSGPIIRDVLAGEVITAGQTVFRKMSTTGKWFKMQCDGTAEESGVGVEWGVALNGAAANQPVAVQTGGVFNPGATVTVGTFYAVSATAGGIAPVADLTSTNKATIIGIGATASTIDMVCKAATGVAVA